ncbi:MAG TPA: glycoside hydrolase family 3 C-terminal domain-containing protein [Candidatus Binatia bacterium]|nr:glycoside hydrolase family 3 C-terminal domain-containing protein [Candidatus Binatia bacterium]
MVADRALHVAAALEVRRERARDVLRAPGVARLQLLADLLVQAPALRWPQVLIEHLLVERVTEGIARARGAVGRDALAGHAQELLPSRQRVAKLLDDLDVPEVAPRGWTATRSDFPATRTSAVAAANSRTIVVLHTAGPVLMPWLPQVAAVLEDWYPGQETGDAIAAVLFEDADPAGRLAMTFPASPDQGPATQPAQYPGVGNEVHYDEGIFVGYRYYDQFAQKPLFPFGYGLSYTSFSLDRLRVRPRDRGQRYTVSVRVRNTGVRAGAAVVQLYAGFPAATGEPPNQLKGFGKVFLKPRRTKRVKIALDQSSFASWSETANVWVVEPGTYTLRVGTSSRDLPLEATVVIQ